MFPRHLRWSVWVLLMALVVGFSPRTVTSSALGPAHPASARAAAQSTTPALPQLGVQFHGIWSEYPVARQEKVLRKIRASGARWVRIDLSWAQLQPRRGSYDLVWGVPRADAVIERARAAGLKVLVMLWMTPSWANKGRGERALPTKAGDYARALAWASDRWRGKVSAWEVWNEPNSEDFLVGASPAAYTRLMCKAYRAARKSNPTATYVTGGVMYNDSAWLRRAYKAGLKGCFDVLATHPYTAPADSSPKLADDNSIWRLNHLGSIRSLMRKNGDTKPIWITEFGWSAHANTGKEQPWARGVTRAQQARYAVDAMRELAARHPYVKNAFWYQSDSIHHDDPHMSGYAMLNRDLTVRPVHTALRRLLR